MSRLVRFALLALVVTVACTGCGSDEDPSAEVCRSWEVRAAGADLGNTLQQVQAAAATAEYKAENGGFFKEPGPIFANHLDVPLAHERLADMTAEVADVVADSTEEGAPYATFVDAVAALSALDSATVSQNSAAIDGQLAEAADEAVEAVRTTCGLDGADRTTGSGTDG